MATPRDLAEANAFSRRRLVTAFVCGAPGGREVAPARSGRAVAGGLALAVLLTAAAAVAGALAPGPPEGRADLPGTTLPAGTSVPSSEGTGRGPGSR